MSVEVINETEFPLDEAEFARCAAFAFQKLHISAAVELSVIFVEPEPMADLHVKWLDLPGPTDVMSFPMDELRPGTQTSPVKEGTLGDVVICPEVARAQALQAGHSAVEEMLLLLIHGILHLLGYDHAEPEEEAVMFALQRRLLLEFLATRQA